MRKTSLQVLSLHSCEALGIRASLSALPRCLYPGWTAIAAVPPPGAQPWPWPKTPLYHLLTTLLTLASGVTLSTGATTAMEHAVRQGQWLPTLGYLPLLLLGWALTVSGARKGQVGVQHMCAHENFFATPWLDAWIGTLVSILLTLGSFEGYERTHGPVHHGQTMMPPDATRRFQEDIIGLRPGMPREECWRKFYHALWSPRVHGQLLAKRLRGHFHFSEATPGHAVATAACMLGVLGLVASSGAWVLFLVVWIVPLTVLY